MTTQLDLIPTPAAKGTATISPDGRHRYTLGRRIAAVELGDLPHLLWVMLNPSKADDVVPDPTITRVAGFTEAHGYGAFRVVNLFAWRHKDPKTLRNNDAAVGPDNDFHVAAEAVHVAETSGARIVVAWGAPSALASKADRAMLARRVERTLVLLAPNPLWCLGTTKDGAPRHPLYLAGSTTLRRWTP